MRSLGGRARQFQRVTRERPPRAPAAVFAAPDEFCETFPNDGNLASTTQDLVWRDADNPNWGADPIVISGGVAELGAGFYGGAEAQSEVADQYSMWVEFDWVDPGATFDDIWLLAGTDNHFLHGDIGASTQAIQLFIFYSGGYYAEIAGYDDSPEFVFVSTVNQAQGRWRLEVDGNESRVYHNSVLIMTADISTASPLPGRKAAFEIESNTRIDNFCYGDLATSDFVPATCISYDETFPNNGAIGFTNEDLGYWWIDSGSGTVSGGQLSTPGALITRPGPAMLTTDQFVQVDFVGGAAGTGDFIYMVLRADIDVDLTVTEGLYAFVNGDGGGSLIEIGNWGGGTLASDTLGVGDHIATWRFEVEGTTGRLYRNGVLMLTADTSAYAWSGKGTGIQMENAGCTIDNFSYGDLCA